ncbi:hypothetical protein SAMN05421548_11747 [Paraburkholderia lycopersici]|uniref:Uncharacterized protein n=1 Tax=Paraburkholderia lycopersici TaxID=416944 RepID=A0A1G6TK57_9BURK|nr:hypothetical protein SAMN05421548_11747 [Paraburkholderia lycopersici]
MKFAPTLSMPNVFSRDARAYVQQRMNVALALAGALAQR